MTLPAPTPAAPGRHPSLWSDLRSFLPEGLELPAATWAARHRLVLVVVALHAILLPAFGALRGWAPAYTLGEGAAIAVLAALAAWPRLPRRARSATAALGLVASSAVLVQFSGGTIEAHFHYFIAIALIALYQDWVPFALAVVFVGSSHGILGMLAPSWVYNHHAALENPWTWALIHAVAVLAQSAALLAFWASAEQTRVRSDSVLDSAGEAMLGLDGHGRVTFANPAAARLLGQSAAALTGQDARSLLPRALPPTVPDKVAHGEGPFRAADGSDRLVEWTLTPTLRAGRPVGSVAVLRDVTARRDLERQVLLHKDHLEDLVAQRTAQLTAANRELEAFSYTVSHDLRSPLRAIDGFSRILLGRHGHELPEESRRMLESLSGGAVRMGNLIESVLSLSRISRTKLSSEAVDLSALAHELLEDLAVKDPVRRVAWSVQPGLGAQGDPNLLRLALSNLLSNAWKFTGKTAAASISVHRAPGRGPAVFVVEDNGAGFDMTHARDLFQPFHRMHQPHEFEGTGIGLATVARILQRHGGRIWAEGMPGRGARFYFVVGTPPPVGTGLADTLATPPAPALPSDVVAPAIRVDLVSVPSRGGEAPTASAGRLRASPEPSP